MEAITALLALGSGIAGLITGGQLGFMGGSLLGSLLTSFYLVDLGIRQGILTLEQAEALGQEVGKQLNESYPGLRQMLGTWEVTEDVTSENEQLGANRFVRGIVRELQCPSQNSV
jgi:hypothetical protein